MGRAYAHRFRDEPVTKPIIPMWPNIRRWKVWDTITFVVVDKGCAYKLPELTIFFEGKTLRFISLWHHFQYGEGPSICLPPFICIDIAILRRLNWWYPFGKLRVYLFGRNIIEL